MKTKRLHIQKLTCVITTVLLVCLVYAHCLLHFENLKVHLVSILISILIDLYLITNSGVWPGISKVTEMERKCDRIVLALHAWVYVCFFVFIEESRESCLPDDGRAWEVDGRAQALVGPGLATPLHQCLLYLSSIVECFEVAMEMFS